MGLEKIMQKTNIIPGIEGLGVVVKCGGNEDNVGVNK